MAHFLRIPLKYWKWYSNDLFGTLFVYAQVIMMRPDTMWSFMLRNSMLRPELIGQVRLANGIFPLWLYKGHLWAKPKKREPNLNPDRVKKLDPPRRRDSNDWDNLG